jgi:hypothetical protein
VGTSDREEKDLGCRGGHRRCRDRGHRRSATAWKGRRRGRRREARGRTAIREPGRSRRRLLRRRNRGCRARQAHLAAGPPGDGAGELHALQEDDEDTAADRPGAGCRVPADGDGALAEASGSDEPRGGQP